jgi:hypothetical protein
MTYLEDDNEQLMGEVFVISKIIKVKISVMSRAEIDNTYRIEKNGNFISGAGKTY